jgi:glutaminase
MRENERRKTNFDQESSKEVECFDADLRFYDESGEFTYKVGLPKWYWRWYCGFIPKMW